MAGEDLYSLLGVARGASAREIKGAYRRLAKRLHPDVLMDAPAAERAAAERAFVAAKEAYEVLSDDRRRAAYDRGGRAGVDRAAAASHAVFRSPTPAALARGRQASRKERILATGRATWSSSASSSASRI